MSEVSLIQQIKQVQSLMDYIKLCVLDMEELNTDMSKWINLLRQDGLTLEFANQFEGVMYMGQVYIMLNAMADRICENDYRYLSDVKEKLESML